MKRKMVAILIVFVLLLGCTSTHKHCKFYEEIYSKAKKIEGRFWRCFGSGLIVITNGTYINGNCSKIYEYSKLNENMKDVLLNVLDNYNLPLEFPIVVYNKPPIIFIGNFMPYKPYVKYLEQTHPYFFFKDNPNAIAIVINERTNFSKVYELYNILKLRGRKVMLYFDTFRAKLLDNVVNRSDNYVIVTKDYLLQKILPLEQAYKQFLTPIEGGNVSVLVFYSPDCPHCEKILPYLKNLSEKYPNVHFEFINILNNSTLANEYHIFAVPTVIIKVGSKTTQLIGETQIRQSLESILKLI